LGGEPCQRVGKERGDSVVVQGRGGEKERQVFEIRPEDSEHVR